MDLSLRDVNDLWDIWVRRCRRLGANRGGEGNDLKECSNTSI